MGHLKLNLLILYYISICLSTSGTTYYIAPNGKDSNPGTSSSPFFTLNKAWTVISAGDLVYLRGGTYYFSTSQELTGKNGTSANPIKIWAYPGETPIITRASSFSSTRTTGIYFIGNYFHWKGITVTGFTQINSGFWGGMRATGASHNIFETLNVNHNGHGFACVGDVGTCDDNLFLNCDFHDNYDPLTPGDPYGNADGLEIGFITSTSATNTVRGCRSWNNSDDGYDMWGNNGFVLFDGCWSWHNGYREDGVTIGGDGNGYKLGKTDDHHTMHLRTVQNSLAFDNKQGGFAQNEAACISWLFNNTAYHNSNDPAGWNLGFEFSTTAALGINVLRNNIAYNNHYPSNTQANYNNCTTSNNTWDGGFHVTDEDFKSVDSTGVSGARAANGDLPDISFLKLVKGSALIDAGIDIGLPFSGNAPDLGAFEYQNPASTSIPKFISAGVQDATPSILDINYDLSLNNLMVPSLSSFTVVDNSVSLQVSAIVISGSKVQLTLKSPVVYGDKVIVSYTRPSQNPLQTSSGGQADSFTSENVTNNCAKPSSSGDPPVLVINYPKTVYEGFVSVIDATSTYDPNKDSLKFEWEVPNGVPVSTVKSLKTQFLAPYVDNSKTVEFQLKVSNSSTILSDHIPITVLPYKPELVSARIIKITASDFQTPDYPENILDGKTSTKWSSNGDNKWLILKLAQPFEISHLKIGFLPEQKYTSYFDIYASADNVSWEPVIVRATSCGFSGEIQIFDFPPSISAKEFSYLKFIGHGNSLNGWNNVSEFKIFGSPRNNQDSTKSIKSKIFIYPNPVRDFINISVEEPALEFNSVRIIDLSGMVVYKKELNQIVKSVQLSVNLKPGLYLLNLSLYNLALYTQKLIVHN
jgi:hypothetical protein